MFTALATLVAAATFLAPTSPADAQETHDHGGAEHADGGSMGARDYAALWDAASPEGAEGRAGPHRRDPRGDATMERRRRGARRRLLTEPWRHRARSLPERREPPRRRRARPRPSRGARLPATPERRPDPPRRGVRGDAVPGAPDPGRRPRGVARARRAQSCHHPDLDPGCADVRGGMLHVWVYPGVRDPFADPMFASMGTPMEWRSKLYELAGVSRSL